MSWSFNHNLDILLPCSSCKLAKCNKFFNLWDIWCIHNTSRSARISKTHCNIIFSAYLKHSVIIFKERILISCHLHPCIYDRTASWYNIHKSLICSELLSCSLVDTTVYSHEINAVFSMHFYNIKPLLCSDILKCLMIIYNCIIYRNCSNCCRTFWCQLSSELLCISERRKIHDSFRTHLYSVINLVKLHIKIHTVSWSSKININLSS